MFVLVTTRALRTARSLRTEGLSLFSAIDKTTGMPPPSSRLSLTTRAACDSPLAEWLGVPRGDMCASESARVAYRRVVLRFPCMQYTSLPAQHEGAPTRIPCMQCTSLSRAARGRIDPRAHACVMHVRDRCIMRIHHRLHRITQAVHAGYT